MFLQIYSKYERRILKQSQYLFSRCYSFHNIFYREYFMDMRICEKYPEMSPGIKI